MVFFYRHSSPSPPPQYDSHGRRINTREYRYRKRLEDERHKLIEKAMKTIPNYHPPQDYRRPTKTQDKVYVPVNDYPEINFSMITNPLTFSPLTISLILLSGFPTSPSHQGWRSLVLLYLCILLTLNASPPCSTPPQKLYYSSFLFGSSTAMPTRMCPVCLSVCLSSV